MLIKTLMDHKTENFFTDGQNDGTGFDGKEKSLVNRVLHGEYITKH